MLEKLSVRERTAVKLAAAALAAFLLIEFGVFPLWDKLETGTAGIEDKELRLRRQKRLIAGWREGRETIAAAEERLKKAESGLLESSSTSLATAEWQRLVRQLADTKGIEVGSSEVLRAERLSADYTVVIGRAYLRCGLDQLVDFVVALATSPKLVAVTNMRISPLSGDPQKRLHVELTIGAPMRAEKEPATGGKNIK